MTARHPLRRFFSHTFRVARKFADGAAEDGFPPPLFPRETGETGNPCTGQAPARKSGPWSRRSWRALFSFPFFFFFLLTIRMLVPRQNFGAGAIILAPHTLSMSIQRGDDFLFFHEQKTFSSFFIILRCCFFSIFFFSPIIGPLVSNELFPFLTFLFL